MPKEYYARSCVMADGGVRYLVYHAFVHHEEYVVYFYYIWRCGIFSFPWRNKGQAKNKDKLIEAELPKFIRAIVQGLKQKKILSNCWKRIKRSQALD